MIGRIVLGPGIVSSRVLAPFVLAPCVLAALTSIPAVSLAQDVPGIEICTAEKTMERRTSCLQSNINFLKTQITTEVGKAKADAQAKLDDAAKQIDALKVLVSGLQAELKQVQADLADAKAKLSKPPAK